MTELFRNRCAKQYLLYLTVGMVLAAAAGGVLIHWDTERSAASLVRQNMALTGALLRDRPMQESPILTGTLREEDIEEGEAALAPYSYYRNMPYRGMPFYHELFGRRLAIYLLSSLAFYVLAAAIGLFVIARMLRSVRRMTEMVRTQNAAGLVSGQEGDMGAHQAALTDLVLRSSHQIQSLDQDKQHLKTLMSDISHQLKTPLSTLRMYNEIMLDKPELSNEKRKEFLQESNRQLERTDWLVQGLLKMARIEAGAVEMQLKNSYLYDTVEMAAAPFVQKAAESGVLFRYEVPEDIRFVHDPQWVAEAFSNLIKNALEHTKESGSVTVEATETPLSVEVQVKDTGVGIPVSEIPHIFERFYQVSGQNTAQNVGIGLSLARSILEKNDAEIRVQPQKPHGTAFIVTFLKKT